MKKIKLLAPFLSVVATAGAIVPLTVSCNKEKDDPKTYTVSLSQDEADKEFTNNVTLDVTEVKEGEDYLGKVTIKDVTKFQLKDKSITVGGTNPAAPVITYNKDDQGRLASATIAIAKDNIKGNLTISGTLVEYIAPLTFTVESGAMESATAATLTIKWEPQRTIILDPAGIAPAFKYNGTKKIQPVITIEGAGIAKASLTFDEPIILDDIDDGVLTFSYIDEKLPEEQHSAEITNIAISKFTPADLTFLTDSPTMTDEHTATLQLMWAGPEEVTGISNLQFSYDGDEKTALISGGTLANPYELTLTFQERIILEDITDGHLTFDYTTSGDSGSDEVAGITIHKYEPEGQAFFFVNYAFARDEGGGIPIVYIELSWIPEDIYAFHLEGIKLYSQTVGGYIFEMSDFSVEQGYSTIFSECTGAKLFETIDDGVLTFYYTDYNVTAGEEEITNIHIDFQE